MDWWKVIVFMKNDISGTNIYQKVPENIFYIFFCALPFFETSKKIQDSIVDEWKFLCAESIKNTHEIEKISIRPQLSLT